MKHSLPIKALTLLFFAFSITAFVLYSGGYFNNDSHNSFQGSHNGGAIITRDSIYQKRKDSLKHRIMSSSKSIIIDDARFDSLVDVRLQKIMKTEQEQQADKEAVIMPSSKVMIIREKKAKISDPPLAKDTLKSFKQRKPKKQQ